MFFSVNSVVRSLVWRLSRHADLAQFMGLLSAVKLPLWVVFAG
jgi:hypothetical protein